VLPRNRFTWDPVKAVINLQRHKIAFEEAWEVFNDQNALVTSDIDHEEQEDRWHIIGQSRRNRTLFVVFCEREQAEGRIKYRIISARKAERNEAKEYEDGH